MSKKKNFIPNAPKSVIPTAPKLFSRDPAMDALLDTTYVEDVAMLNASVAPTGGYTFMMGASQWTSLTGAPVGQPRPPEYYKEISKTTSTVPVEESDDIDSNVLDDRLWLIDQVNWCMANCVGKWRILPATVTRVTTTYGWGDADDDELDPAAFSFDLVDDGVLFHLKFGGTQ